MCQPTQMSGDHFAIKDSATEQCYNNLYRSSSLSTSSIKACNITDKFLSACHYAVEPGDLVHGNGFALQNAMSAIEIMDPKMDVGMRGSRCVTSVSESLKKGCLPLGPFTELDMLLGIIDELLAATVNWLTGDSLPQSVFICMYMHCTQLLRDPYLSIFCEILRRVIRKLQEMIASVSIFDEEDHYSALHGMPLAKPSAEFDVYLPVSPSDTFNLYSLSDMDLISKSKQLSDSLFEGDLQLGNGSVRACISSRLKFMHTFLEVVLVLFSATRDRSEANFDGYSSPVFPPNQCRLSMETGAENETCFTESALSSYGELKPFVNEANQLHGCAERGSCSANRTHDDTGLIGWNKLGLVCTELQQPLSNLVQLCEEMLSTVTVGRPSGQGRLSPKDNDYGLPGFEPFLNQNVLPSFIPRFVVIRDRSVAFSYWSQLVTRLKQLISSFNMLSLVACDSYNSKTCSTAVSGTLCYLLWCLLQSNGQKTNPKLVGRESGHVFDVHPNICADDISFASCIVSRTITYLLLISQLKTKPASESTLLNDNHARMTLCSWLVLEPCHYQAPLKDIIRQQRGLLAYFSLVSDNLKQIPTIYCFNRSRQRSALYQYLQTFTNMLSESQRVEWILCIELSKLMAFSQSEQQLPVDTGNQAANTPHPVRLCHTAFLCYIYYQLIWDFIVSGFQLELYAPHEWIFTYTFLIQLLQSLSDLSQQMMTIFTVSNSVSPVHERECDAAQQACKSDSCQSVSSERPACPSVSAQGSAQPIHAGSRSKGQRKAARKKRSRAAKSDSDETSNHEISAPSLPSHDRSFFAIPGSDVEMLSLTCHRFMTAATMYCLRALQIDSGGDPVLDGRASEASSYLNPLEVYKRRLGIFITSPDSPLYESHGVVNAFESCKQYLTTDLFSFTSRPEDISRLYSLASKNFDNARIRAQQGMPLWQEKQREHAGDPRYLLGWARHLGPPDNMSDLEKLARHNCVACRVLAGCPDRRPRDLCWYSWNSTGHSTSASVRLEFDAVPSRMYPLIRLVSQSAAVENNS